MRRIPLSPLAALLVSVSGLSAGQARAQATIVNSGHTITPAATAEQAVLCAGTQAYPAQWDWGGAFQNPAGPATSGTPRIDQIRNGVLIASYTSFADDPDTCTYKGDGTDWKTPEAAAATGCGPFTREHSWRLWAPGDVFEVYPAVYSGDNQQPWFGPEYDGPAQFNANKLTAMKNITIVGLILDDNTRPVIQLAAPASNNTLGQAPVYFDTSMNVTFSNIIVQGLPGMNVGKAGIYESGGSNLTISNVEVTGFQNQDGGANGIFGADYYSGTLTLDSVELDHNGGDNGPAHNAYIGHSYIDPNFKVVMTHSWSHDAVYGHLFKSRAQQTEMIGNYFEGGLPQPGQTQAETYLLDVPNGGKLVARDNLFVKNASGPDSNGFSITYALEGLVDSRPLSIDIENNTFISFAATFDGVNPNIPLAFYYPNLVPGKAGWPAKSPAHVYKNAFAGYCPVGTQAADYRGEIDVTEALAEIAPDFSLLTPFATDDSVVAQTYPAATPAIGQNAYGHEMLPSLQRALSTIGAED